MRTQTGLAGIVALLATVALAGQPAFAANSPSSSPPTHEPLAVMAMIVNGSGCPAETVATAVAPDNSAFTVAYASFIAVVGVGATPLEFRRNCQVMLTMRAPAGYTFGIAEVSYVGYAYLEPGATGILRESYYPAEGPRTTMNTHRFTGPMDDFWQVTNGPVTEQSYFACGTTPTIVIPTELRVQAGTSDPTTTTSYLSFDAVDAPPSGTYRLAWTTC